MNKLDEVDYFEAGVGPTVVLLHATATGARQWKNIINGYKDKFHFVAVNLIGYGNTPKWESDHTQRLSDQVSLFEKIPPIKNGRFSIIAHSFGGSVALMAALRFHNVIDKLVLIEPNPFYLLKQAGLLKAYNESLLIQKKIKNHYRNDWEKAVQFFANYWNGEGSWDRYTNDQKEKFSEILKPNFHEWDAVLNETISIEKFNQVLPKNTTFVSALDTVFSIKEITKLFMSHCKTWKFESIQSGGHMAIIKKPDQVLPIIIKALL